MPVETKWKIGELYICDFFVAIDAVTAGAKKPVDEHKVHIQLTHNEFKELGRPTVGDEVLVSLQKILDC